MNKETIVYMAVKATLWAAGASFEISEALLAAVRKFSRAGGQLERFAADLLNGVAL